MREERLVSIYGNRKKDVVTLVFANDHRETITWQEWMKMEKESR